MQFATWTDLDRLIFDRWTDLVELRQAVAATEKKLKDNVAEVGRRVETWAKDKGYGSDTATDNGPSIYVYKPDWIVDDLALVHFTVGGIVPNGFLATDESAPFIMVEVSSLKKLGLKGPAREEFGRSLRDEWKGLWPNFQHEPEDPTKYALLEYLRKLDDTARLALALDPDAMLALVTDQFERLFPLAAGISARLEALKTRAKP
jgi:hypothetical protein